MADIELKNNLENTLFTLLEKGASPGFDQAGLLVLISLVNLMGILNLITKRMGSQEDKN